MEYIPPCKEKRTFFNLFKIFSCKNCKFYDVNEYYVVGELNFNIYRLNNLCEYYKINIDYQGIMFSNKLKLLLKDSIISNNENIIVWLDNFDYSINEELMFNLLSFDLDVQIISNN